MGRLSNKIVWAEMARRKIRFHPGEDWDKINLWGLFQWGDVSHLLKTGELKTHMKKENKIIWVTPSREAWEKKIKPLLQHTPDELAELAGWKI